MSAKLKITKGGYERYVKPLCEKAQTVANSDLALTTEIFFSSFLLKIINNETKPECLLDVLSKQTGIQKRLANECGLQHLIDEALKYLEGCKVQ